MKDKYDFSTGKRSAIASTQGKTRITIMLDDAVIEATRELAENNGTGYQTMINHLLRQALGSQDMPEFKRVSTAKALNRVLGTPKLTKSKAKPNQ
jgi:hypothetical protein